MDKLEKIKKVLENVNGCTFAGIDTVTEVKLTGGKSNPFQGRVRKHTIGSNIMLFSNTNSNGYENMVRNRLIQEGKDPETFKLGELPWGKRIDNTPIIENKGKYYIQTIFIRSGESKYYVDGVLTDKDQIQGIPENKESNDSQGGLDNKVVVRTYAIDSISELRLDGKNYVFV